MLQLQNLAGQCLAQGQDGAAAELGKVHILAHLFAHFIILVNLACLRKGNLPVVILHLPVGHDRTVAVDFKVALVRIHDHVVVVVRAEELGDDAPEDYIVHGPNRITALPMEVPVCYQEVAHCLEKSISKVETAILSALENTPPELYADIVHNGIYLAGGGALLRGLDKRLTDKINIPFHIAEDPLHAVAKGTGVALKNVDRFSFLMR